MDSFVLQPLGAVTLDVVLDVASALHRACFGPMGERVWTRQDIAGLLASPGVCGLLLQHDGRDIGFVLSRVVADEAEVLTIAIDPAHRRRGAGGRLLQAVIGNARAAGTRSLYLEVGVDNPVARALYAKAGFEEVGRRSNYYQRGPGKMVDALIMRLKLAG